MKSDISTDPKSGLVRLRIAVALVVGCLGVFLSGVDGVEKVQIMEQAEIDAINLKLAVAAGLDPFGAASSKAGLLEPAQMKIDSGSQEILAQADLFVKQGRFDLASILWQRVIDESGDQVFTLSDWNTQTNHNIYKKYLSVNGAIETTLNKLPKEGLAAYRLKADGEARALMRGASGKSHEAALAEIVRRYFLSKLGDDAAFELACLKLDRGEFLPAARLLGKIVDEYPDPSVRMGDINIRLAAVSARIGNLERARELLSEMKAQAIPPVPMQVIRLVEEDVERVAKGGSSAGKLAGAWTLPQGGPTRSGLMPSPRQEFPEGLIEGWKQGFQLTLPDGAEWEAIAAAEESEQNQIEQKVAAPDWMRGADPFGQAVRTPTKKEATDEEIVGKWQKNGWKPVGQVLMQNGCVYFKTDDRLVCCDASTGELIWFSFRSEYPEDPNAELNARYRSYGRSSNTSSDPSGERELISFSDRLNQSMAIVGERLLVVQGRAVEFYEDGDLDKAGIDEQQMFRGRQRFGRGINQATTRARDNRLFSYNAKNGKLLWILKPSEMLPDAKRKVGLAGSPVPYGSLVVVPLFEGSSLWLVGLDPEKGEVIWQSFLADEPAGQTDVHSPVRIAIDGGEAYVATGAGIVASVDAISGTLNWAVAYPRTTPTQLDIDRRNRRYYGSQTIEFDGWDGDTVIPSGNAIVFAPSDFNHLGALDRRTGELLWESARTPIEGEPASEYVLGVVDGRVLVAGTNVVRCYRLGGGRLLWEHMLDEPSFARGMLTDAGIYIPLRDSVLQISIPDGKPLGSIQVETGKGTPPLGNLYTDGENIFSSGFRELKRLRARESGEKVPEPAPVDEPVAEIPPAGPHEALAAEARKAMRDAYETMVVVRDPDTTKAAVAAFDAASGNLEGIARRMETLGKPSAETLKVLREAYAREQTEIGPKVRNALPQIFAAAADANEVLLKMMSMHKTIERLTILKAYGITGDPINNDGQFPDEPTE